MTWTEYPDNRGPGRPSKYNLKKIPIGESVFFPSATTHNVHRSACEARKWNPSITLRVKCRSVVKNGTAGTKVTRIE
jgi:hypothetical protein